MSLKALTLTAIASMTLAAGVAHAGPGEGGGGSGVVLSDGSVRFVDLMGEAEIANAQSNALKYKDVIKKIYESHRFVKVAAVRDPNFFAPAVSVLNKQSSNFPVFERLAKTLSDVDVLETQFQIVTLPDDADFEALSQKYPLISSASHRLSADRQEALATYANGQVWISYRLASRLSVRDQLALSLHESLRQLNFTSLINQKLSQDEIEAMTRNLMGLNADGSTLASAIKKVKDESPTPDQMHAMALKYMAQSEIISNARGELLAHKPTSPSAIANWQAEADRLDRDFNDLQDKATQCDTQYAQAVLSSTKLKSFGATGFVNRALIYGALTEPLPGSTYFDITTFKIVHQ